MKVGIHITNFGWPGGAPAIGPTLAEIGRAAEDGGIASISVMDHFFQMEGRGGPSTAAEPMLEGYTTLGFLAGVTTTPQLHLLVTGVTYRHPGILAKTVSTLDVLSGGRAALGIGAAWYQREHEALGVPFPPLAERYERLEETIRIVLQMWSDDRGPFQGTHYRLAETLDSPHPIQRPHPPILIGGSGERKTLRVVARYADACNFYSREPAEIAHKLEVLREHCGREGTDYQRIEKTMMHMGPASPEEPGAFAEAMGPYAELGIGRIILLPFGPDPVGFVKTVGERVVPALAGL
jgi:F420-dependent oxidoreductase-like protein